MAELFDIVLRRQIYIEGLKAAKGLEFGVVLNRLRNALTERLQRFEFENLGDATRTALKALIADLRKIARSIFDPYLTGLIDWLQRFVNTDADMLTGLYRKAMPERAAKLDKRRDNAALWALAVKTPLAATGTLALPFLQALLPALYVKLERLTFQHYANHATKAELVNAIVGPIEPVVRGGARAPSVAPVASDKMQGLMRQLSVQADAVTNTLIQHMGAQVAEALGEAVLDHYEWVSVLDNRTTAICISRDGNRYEFGKGPVPPAHVNCRSTIVPVRLSDPPTPNSFFDWLSGQPGAFIDDALAGQRSARYERSSPISLNEYGTKSALIGL